ncbi:MAG: hypothetical protein CLLPBCKN_007604 [Chroococcidiopsis cubana SAG 39.79]|uniref:DUF3011 domain-containing protein n=1 Tax=Chroococcidiopsis cubana TaxID=171392 RepID=UPI000D05E760|nr:DUF3011 domain-containing protein [Chroococcidiopsis cubana]MDZ4878169.1 hypothetical protein [Chroococcidiopsis cubana SAG 39.79]PSB66550.1 hypothetical protein C7B79_00385 [Chroococcidiopsis cubana CCALA 043]
MVSRFSGIAIAFVMTSFTMVGTVLVVPTQASAQQVVTCESNNRERNTCRINTRGDVRLIRRLSNASCDGNWGYNRNRIWVRNGCRARFLVDNRRDRRYNRRDRNDRYDWDGRYDRRNRDDRYDRRNRDGRYR